MTRTGTSSARHKRPRAVTLASVAEHDLPWARLWERTCTAVREQRPDAAFWGLCELRRFHAGDHALDRGFDVPRWSTDWTDHPVVTTE